MPLIPLYLVIQHTIIFIFLSVILDLNNIIYLMIDLQYKINITYEEKN